MAQPSIIDLLRQDHETMARLFGELSSTFDAAERKRRFAELCDTLDAHSLAETAIVYAALTHNDETGDLVPLADDEHMKMKSLSERIKARDAEGTELSTAVATLRGLVAEHVQYEESEIFDALRAAFSDRELERLGTDFLGAKKVAAAA